MIPLTMAAGRISLPDTLRITGRHTSIAVAPADATGANGPKCLFIAWAATNVNSSLNMFTSNAIVPSSEAARTPRDASGYSGDGKQQGLKSKTRQVFQNVFIRPYFHSHKEEHQAYDGGNDRACMLQESAPPEYETCTYSCRQCQYQINHNSQKSAKDSNFRIKAQIEYLMKNV